MLKRRIVFVFLAAALIAYLSGPARSQDSQDDQNRRHRKYTPPPDTAHISVTVVKETNGKPIDHAAVIFHILQGSEKDKGNMELKTNNEGQAIIDVIPMGQTVRLQIIASGFQTFGDDYKIDSATKEIIVKMKRPTRQYSTYEHPETQGAQSGTQPSTPTADTPPPPK